MTIEFWISAVVLLAALTAIAFTARASGNPLRRTLGFLSAGAVVLSCCFFDYMWIVAIRVSGLTLSERANALAPWMRAGSYLALGAFVGSFFAVKWARLSLVVISFAMCLIWYGAGMGL